MKEAASTCATRNEFKKRFASAYRAMCARGLTETVLGHIQRLPRKGKTKWTIETAKEVAAKYDNLDDFRRDYSGLCSIAHGKGWYWEITSHIPRQRGKPRIWTKETCQAAALTYTSRKQFRELDTSAYVVAKREGWLQDICSHMRVETGLSFRSVYVMRLLFTKIVYVGISHDPTQRYAAHRRRPATMVRAIIDGHHAFKVIAANLPADRAADMERKLIRRLSDSGYDVRNTKCGGDMGSNKIKWTREALRAVAASCRSRTEMRLNHASAYSTACSKGIISALFANHPNGGYMHQTRRQYSRR